MTKMDANSTNANASKTGYMRQLDGIRAVAIFAVLIPHFTGMEVFVARIAHWQRMGVILFFVLSGFLITGILLNSREASLEGNHSRWSAVRVFYIRRVLRIFPIYYLTLLACVLLRYNPVKANLFWHVAYLSNISGPLAGTSYGAAAHLWTLCVEEQFYLMWPFVILFAPRRSLRRIVIIIIVTALCYKTLVPLLGLSWAIATRPLLGCLDSLGLGALLALQFYDRRKDSDSGARLARNALLVGLPLLVALQSLWFRHGMDARLSIAYISLVDLSVALSSLALIRSAALNSSGAVGAFLGWEPIRYVGKISYGIYLYHLFLVPLAAGIFGLFGFGPIPPGWSRVGVYGMFAIMLSALSWHVVEKPINRMKRHFPYLGASG
jgi:peptidoglycan/LPS O-acetylase OafA/YrhL